MAQRQPLADIQFIAALREYALSRGGDAYNYFSSESCAIAQFVVGTGLCEDASVGAYHWTDKATGKRHDFPVGFRAEVEEPHTFSALADRLEALLIDAPTVERG